jgi:hypothetical protein
MSLMFLAPFVASASGKGPITWDGFTAHNKTASGVTCYSICEISSDGSIFTNSLGSSISTTQDRGTWLNPGYTASDYWVIHGTLSGSPGTLNYVDEISTRANLGTDRHVGVQETSTLDTHTCSVPLEFYDASVGGNLLETATISLQAFKDTP